MTATRHPHPLIKTNHHFSAETPVVGHRKGGGIRRGALRSVRVQLLIPILVATVGLTVLGSVQTAIARAESGDAYRARLLANTAVDAIRLVHELGRELNESVVLRNYNDKAGSPLIAAQHTRTDELVNRYRVSSEEVRKKVPGMKILIDVAETEIDALGSARTGVMNSPGGRGVTENQSYRSLSIAMQAVSNTVPLYIRNYQHTLISLLAVAEAMPSYIVDPIMASSARSIAILSSLEYCDLVERLLVQSILLQPIPDDTQMFAVAALDGQREERLAEFYRVATNRELAVFDSLYKSDDIEKSKSIIESLLQSNQQEKSIKIDPEQWYVAQSGLIRRVNFVILKLSDWLEQYAKDVEMTSWRRAWGTAIGTAGIAIATLTMAMVLAIRISRRLRRLRAAALTVARYELPDAIAAVAAGVSPSLVNTGPSAGSITTALADSHDEIGEVADAFATVHRRALHLAGEQAEIRVDISRMAEILARRIRTLITRQLRLLDEFERNETDPDALARLFALDHLAARLRRNGENLLVLAGGDPGKSYNKPMELSAVLQAAVSEIEDYSRIEVMVGEIIVVGNAVEDVVRLLAELLENATAFSPPHTSVQVDARLTSEGAVVRIHDNGIGITEARLGEINTRLTKPVSLTSAAAGTMGLNVVSHLSARHAIQVQLHAFPGGTVAYVMLPHSTLTTRDAMVSAVGTAWDALTPPSTRSITSTTTVASPGPTPLALAEPFAGQPVAASKRKAFLGDGDGDGDGEGPRNVWFSTPPGFGDDSSWGEEQTATSLVWSTPKISNHINTEEGCSSSVQSSSQIRSIQPKYSVPHSGGVSAESASTGLPFREPGALLAPEAKVIRQSSMRAANMVDPETIRIRLSAFAEGVSAALNRTTPSSPTKE